MSGLFYRLPIALVEEQVLQRYAKTSQGKGSQGSDVHFLSCPKRIDKKKENNNLNFRFSNVFRKAITLYFQVLWASEVWTRSWEHHCQARSLRPWPTIGQWPTPRLAQRWPCERRRRGEHVAPKETWGEEGDSPFFSTIALFKRSAVFPGFPEVF